ncbi:MAG: acetolactate synthase [Lachnospiraceae bacterium]|nr:acetolactate synthase [Lachnospiraceae bacterium]
MSVKQISVFLENRPGTLQKMTAVLAENKVNMRATSLAETKDFGIARIIVDDDYEASNVLKEAGFINSLTPVLAVEIKNEVGALSKTLQVFSEGAINIEYMYSFLSVKRPEHACMIFRVSDTEKAEAFLGSHGVRLLNQDELSDL